MTNSDWEDDREPREALVISVHDQPLSEEFNQSRLNTSKILFQLRPRRSLYQRYLGGKILKKEVVMPGLAVQAVKSFHLIKRRHGQANRRTFPPPPAQPPTPQKCFRRVGLCAETNEDMDIHLKHERPWHNFFSPASHGLRSFRMPCSRCRICGVDFSPSIASGGYRKSQTRRSC